MALSRLPWSDPARAALDQAMRLLGTAGADDMAIRQAAWVARCVGRGEAAPLTPDALTALAATLHQDRLERGAVIFHGGQPTTTVWIVQHGRVELSVGSGRRRTVVGVLRPGDVDGDIQLLLDMALPYTARALDDTTVLSLAAADFEHLLATSLPIARRWLSSVAQRLAASQMRLLGLLGHTLTEQVARLLLDEAVDGQVSLPQRTLAAMLGAQRPSLNKILKELEREGLIGVRYAAIDILDADTLAKRAG
ncbi:Crp/Fnr family transcriptional regulator [Saccharothrix sp.]|uniref:Crp/Fnr family transcriptional regulator n=1 Tax=Saccharothrix sp. TaxID=1873460 RepID=UPI002812061B|nr:Crp/Fnr family transcriptional regulator [Saccharothrix sp.]